MRREGEGREGEGREGAGGRERERGKRERGSGGRERERGREGDTAATCYSRELCVSRVREDSTAQQDVQQSREHVEGPLHVRVYMCMCV